MQNKKLGKFIAVALLGAFSLTACNDEVIAKPTGYDDNSPVVKIGDYKIYNNVFTDIYDGIREGSVATDVLNQLLYQFSVSVFGNYNAITASKISSNANDVTTLKAAVKGLTKDGSGVYSATDATKAFIKAHSAYWTKNQDGDRINDSNTVVDENADPSQSEYARLNEKWQTIEDRIAEALYKEVSGGTYSERNVFYEERYVRSLSTSLKNVKAINDGSNYFEGVITPKVEDKEVFTKQTEDIEGNLDYILHRENYQTNAALDATETAEDDATYVEDEFIPTIYRQLLVEQYILDESYDTLGRTSARKINVLAIAKSSQYSRSAIDLMNTFVNDYIFDNTGSTVINLDSFKMVSSAWAGAFMSEDDATSTDEYTLMNAAGVQMDDDNKYFLGTAYGDMQEEIEKIKADPTLTENESTYTGNNAYTIEIGEEIKTRELLLKDYTTTGWFIKSIGVTALPESLKSQLFDINVANALNGSPCVEYTYGTEWTTNEDQEVINVVGKVNGKYYLRNTSRIKGNPIQSDILFEEGGTYYIVQIEDAIKSVNLSKANYKDATPEELDKLETYVNEIVKIVADNDTYKTLSKKHWLKEMQIEYHDTVVYDYFKSNFPELFED